MSKPVCTVMVGLPAMGKSTLIDSMYKDEETWIYSTDNYIERCAEQNGWTYDQAFPEFIEPATKYMNEMLDIAMRSKQDIVWDQTNLGVGKRKKIINRMRQAGYDVDCICIVPPEPGDFDDLKVWKQRLQNRPGKTIPQHVLSNMIENYVQPKIEEGFDLVAFYNMHGALIGIEYGEDS